MKIPSKTWQNYIKKLAKINTRAAGDVVAYMVSHDVSTYEGTKALIDYAHAVSTKYGEAAAELSCQMYDAIATVSKAAVPVAEPAATATYGEIAKTIYGTLASTKNPDEVGAAVGRSVKLASVDTLMKNTLRDGAEWAWIPAGDTCPFCLMLASNGWQKASKKALKNGHADHIHNNCDCTYCVRFDHETTVEGYDPDTLYDEYINAGDTPRERLNALSRQHYASNKDYINAQKRAAYARRKDYDNATKGFSNGDGDGIINNRNGILPGLDRVPNAITAATIQDKIQNYLLNSNHRRGKDKARVLNSVLGFHYQNWESLSNRMFDKLQTTGYTKKVESNYGVKYIVPMRIDGLKGKSMVLKTVWQIDHGTNIPRFITSTFDLKSIRSK